jgi:hypothetical protein
MGPLKLWETLQHLTTKVTESKTCFPVEKDGLIGIQRTFAVIPERKHRLD